MSNSTPSRSNQGPFLERHLSGLETGSFGLSGLLIWLGTASSMHFALGGTEIWVWLPATIVSILLNLHVYRLGNLYPNVSGGTPNYITRLLKKYPFGACYSAIGYFIGWVSVPPMNAIVLTDLIEVQLSELNIYCPKNLLRVIFTILPFLLAFSGIRSLSILHLFFVLPAVGFLVIFCIQGLAWLALSPESPGFFPPLEILQPTSLSFPDWAKWYLIAIYTAYAGETCSSFVAESKNSATTLRFLKISAFLIPIVYIGGSWVLMRLASISEVGESTFLNLSVAASYFWGESTSILVTFLIVSGVLLCSVTAVSNTPRVLYQLAVDDYLSPVFRVVTRQGTLLPSLVFTFTLALICLIWGDISRVVMVTGTSYAVSIMAIHLGSWLQRGKPESFLPWLSLLFFFIETLVLVVGGIKWNWNDLVIGLLLPILVIAFDKIIYYFPRGVFSSNWWLRRGKENYDSDKNFLTTQVTGLLLFVCSSFIAAWLAKGFFDKKFSLASNNLLVLLTITIAFICITIASWTSLQQVAAIDEARKNAERRLIAALDTVHDTILVVDENGIVNQANPAAEFLFGFNNSDLLGNKLSKFIPDFSESPALWRHGEYELHHQYIRDIEVSVSQRSKDFSHEYIVILRDISERKQALREQAEMAKLATAQAQQLEATLHDLQKTQSQLIQTEKMSSLGQLVAGVAHEINNPVSFIYGNLPILNDYFQDLLQLVQIYQQQSPQLSHDIDIDFLEEDLPKTLNSLKIGADRIKEIVLTLRNFSRLDEAEMKPVNIHEGIDSTLLILQSRLKHEGKNQEIQIIKQYGEIPECECYAGQLNQVFMNIISNAIDALRMSESKINHPEIIIQTMMLKMGKITISIKDNGMGMSEEVKAKLFDPFFTTKPIGKGTGLGLSISYQIIVYKHKGDIECISSPNQGCEFVIEIPIPQQNNISI